MREIDDICYCRKNPCICLRHDAECEAELTSHGYTPCRCDERARIAPVREGETPQGERCSFKDGRCVHCGEPESGMCNGGPQPAGETPALIAQIAKRLVELAGPTCKRETERHVKTLVERLSTSEQERAKRIDVVHKILHEFTGRPCRDDGGWCDARDHAEAIIAALGEPR